MYGLIGRIKAVAGKRAELASMLVQDGSMPGCISYLVGEDVDDPDALWITEVWTDKAAHDASLGLPAVREAIARGRPLIAGFDHGVVTNVLGGIGLR
jgi:quinol monooxygenase YgiN